MPNPSIFISYRIEDSKPDALLLFAELTRYFGENEVFLDKRGLELGVDWPDVLAANVRKASIVLVLIKDESKWLGVKRLGRRRMDDPDDWVRLEIETALSSGKTVVPILVDGASIPPKSDLPPSLHDLHQKQGRKIAIESVSDISALLADLEKTGLQKKTSVHATHTPSTVPVHTDQSCIPQAKSSEIISPKKGINLGWISVFVLLLSGLIYFLSLRQGREGNGGEIRTVYPLQDSVSQETNLVKSAPIAPVSNNGVSAPKPASTPTIELPNVLQITGTPNRYADIFESKISKVLRDQHILHQIGSGGGNFENRIECVFDVKKSSAQIGMREGFKYMLTLQVKVYGQSGGKCFSGSYASSTPRIGYAEDTDDEQRRKVIEPGLDEIRIALQQNPPTLCKKRH